MIKGYVLQQDIVALPYTAFTSVVKKVNVTVRNGL